MEFKKTQYAKYTAWLKTLNHLPDILEEFSVLSSDHDRAAYLFKLLNQQPCNLFSESSGKNNRTSEQARELGNTNYKYLYLHVALADYTKSIAYAPLGSKELALALGNRSACLLKLGLMNLALSDVSAALEIPNLDNKYFTKLDNRKKECLKKLEQDEEYQPTPKCPELPTRNDYLISATKKIALAEDSEMGRQLIANDEIKTGEILIVEKPYSKISLPEAYFTHCTHCLSKCNKLIPCSNCATTLFCSKKCMDDANKKYHHIECPILEKLNNLEMGKMAILSLRILIEASDGGNKLEELEKSVANFPNSTADYRSDDFIQIYKLVGNTDKRTTSDLFYRTFSACVMATSLSKFTTFFDQRENLKPFAAGLLLRFIQSLPCNAHEITDVCNGEAVEIGAGAFATLSLLNHSCDPNVVRHSCGETVVLRAIRTIKHGEEVVDNYGYHYATHGLMERQSSLSGQYYFTCSCEPCTKSWPLYNDLPSGNPIYKAPVNEEEFKKLKSDFEKKLGDVIQNEISTEALDFLCTYLDYLDVHIGRPWQIYNNCQEAIKHALNFITDYHRRDDI